MTDDILTPDPAAHNKALGQQVSLLPTTPGLFQVSYDDGRTWKPSPGGEARVIDFLRRHKIPSSVLQDLRDEPGSSVCVQGVCYKFKRN